MGKGSTPIDLVVQLCLLVTSMKEVLVLLAAVVAIATAGTNTRVVDHTRADICTRIGNVLLRTRHAHPHTHIHTCTDTHMLCSALARTCPHMPVHTHTVGQPTLLFYFYFHCIFLIIIIIIIRYCLSCCFRCWWNLHFPSFFQSE